MNSKSRFMLIRFGIDVTVHVVERLERKMDLDRMTLTFTFLISLEQLPQPLLGRVCSLHAVLHALRIQIKLELNSNVSQTKFTTIAIVQRIKYAFPLLSLEEVKLLKIQLV